MVAIIDFGEMALAIVLAIVLLAISTTWINEAVPLFAVGVVAWTVGEYVVHRFVLHNLAPTRHSLHHAHPDVPVVAVFWANMDILRARLFRCRRRFSFRRIFDPSSEVCSSPDCGAIADIPQPLLRPDSDSLAAPC